MQNITTLIDSGWEFAERLPARRDFFFPQGGEKLWLPAQIPGHVHLDLMRNGVIGDPFYRMQERACQWVDEADWTYRTTINVSAERLASRGEYGKHFLHFHGQDTICRVFLNGVKVGEAENFFIPHRFDVTDLLREGDNELRVEFDSALRVGRERAEAYLGDGTSDRGSMSYFNFGPRAFVRKAQYMFGWDWGSELVSCGIWQKVELITVPVAEITGWRYEWGTPEGDMIPLTVIAEITRYDPVTPLRLRSVFQPALGETGNEKTIDVTPIGTETMQIVRRTLVLPFARVARWSLNSEYRYQPMDTLRLSVEPATAEADRGSAGSQVKARIAYRTIELIREPDADGKGEGFKFRVNGVDTFIKGANWIPDHSFPAIITKEQLRERIQQAKDAGFNMLRVWGGGYYETEDFYDLCDVLGILVWQDFPFACSMYPDDLPEFNEEVRKEAIAAVKRIRNHPCLALWCGGNENLELAQGRWAGATQAKRFYGDTTIHQVLPEVLAEHDPNTPYWPNSPYGGENCTSEDYGDSHYWNVWHSKKPDSTGDWIHYAESTTRFSSEFGFAAPAGMTAWDSCMAPEDKTVRSPVSIWHDKTRKGYETYLGFITRHYPDPATFEDLIYYGQCNQADALKFGVEHYRRMKGRCWGTLFWQWNDCWQTHSWAVIDSLGEPKAAYYACKRFYAPVLVSLFREGDAVHAHLVNDTLDPVSGTLEVRLQTFAGEELARERAEVTVGANVASGVLATISTPSRTDAFVHATLTGKNGELLGENFGMLGEPKNLSLPDPGLRWRMAMPSRALCVLSLSAARFAGYVHLRFEGLERQPKLSDNFFHLAPGQERTIEISGAPPDLSVAELSARLRIRHL
ncbi:MAG: glycoside hydrolase family 2 protein [Capsulimonadales bacterium]|nr:glycoside hydrolase family 2 protein [Capsulimonadales bacterium]